MCHKMGLLAHCCSEWLKVRECWALEQSDDRQVSRLRGKKSDGRHRKTGRQVNISDGDRPQRTLCLLHSCLSENTCKVLTVHFSTQQDIHYQGTGEPVCEKKGGIPQRPLTNEPARKPRGKIVGKFHI